MTNKEQIYKFKLEYDKLDSNDFPKLELPQILLYLNKAQTATIEQIYDPDDNKLGFETTQLTMDHLSPIHVKSEPLVPLIVSTGNPNEYYFNLSNLSQKYMHLTRSYSYGTSPVCGSQILDNLVYTSNELNQVLKDPNRKPSFEWQEIPITVAQDRGYFYTDGTFTLETVKWEYLREPKEIDMAGYTKFDGSPSIDQDCEFDNTIAENIINLALVYAKTTVGDFSGAQATAGAAKLELT